VSFNFESFCSYNKKQGFNAPVSEEITFKYTTALNYLLQFDSRQKIQIGDATTVFWAEDETPVEGFLKDVLDSSQNNQSPSGDLRRFLEAVRDGKMPKEIDNTKNMRFYILGLSPNASRLSVRFWYISTVEDVSRRIGQHFKDLKIIKSEKDPEYPGIWHLLHETAAQGKTKNISPLIAGALIRSIITGVNYPSGILTAVIERIRADQQINYLRASLIKAYLNRRNRIRNPNEKEVIGMALNREEKNIGYRLGRLFAILEKAQKDAVPGANTTIKDRFYGSASATPAVVFPQLLRLTQHHIQKSDFGAIIEKWIEEIMCDIKQFPSHLSLEEQGMFAIGYYHQKQECYKKTEKKEE
jgi:CRISPR-associated protein Csd1